MLYNFSDNAFISRVNKQKLNKELFSIKDGKDLLFYETDLKSINKISKGLPKEFNDNDIQDFLSSLNFLLTKDQLSTIEDILKDMKESKRMNRLVLGDVGSGKTIIAI